MNKKLFGIKLGTYLLLLLCLLAAFLIWIFVNISSVTDDAECDREPEAYVQDLDSLIL